MISQINIKNFRSIKELRFEPNSLTALIGPNSSGKTNVLKAIDLVLGEGWTTKAKVARELFNDTTKSIEIEIVFNTPISVPSNSGYRDTEVSSVELTMSLIPELSARTTINGGSTFYGQETFKKLCHFIFITSDRNLSSELRVSQWTMLGKMMRLVYENYVIHYDNNEQKLKDEFKEKMSLAKEFLEDDFSQDITFKKFVDTFKAKCKENSLGLACDFDPSLDIYNLNWFYKTLQVHVKEDIPNKHFDSEEVGAGMQNLLMISIFQTYSELMGGKVIFGIEEPEIYLYPQAQRSLYKSFIELSENTQIIYTTHNPNFVSAYRADDILLLRRSSELGTYKLKKDDYFNSENAENDGVKYKIYTHFNAERNELFFAKKVLLVEGASDKILFTTLCEEKWNIDLDALGISVISCSGKGGVNYFLGVCNLIGLETYFAVWDEDPEDKSYKPEKDFLPNVLSNGTGLEVAVNLESFLGLSSSNDSGKVKNAHKWALDVKFDEIPDEFQKLKDFLSEEIPDIDNSEKLEEPMASSTEDDIPF
ncbi:hypothetical protein CO051_06010 [Candidatus Roizmanbacteria bacterium CG_4_9_14_0_2_um_filter_39_13]|uniref:ATP-dependent endonuclease n=2 Tax=Candidatus Roizmaniibacteriota TaxID=1752723 RepID=A0A2M8EWY6_9BACT|nr:MAG: hypothetical protein COY15_04475 [Candidatus Roizmanbacteria bacterium CG_4_10_14_0_2_um_filter_39_12]PJC30377.1 MAG: hypothetical protein CO051_06010 [Candidatus Roizmanbacteria bacterium CG_4_9_14_0_2_um_filter_39_13]PJE61350.1 MAG: hypothetical protein COU87_05010 [Candidatus Roizmanbacteria bacterium CG10_big_fil_rev_8_21_14_0_10_39_12]